MSGCWVIALLACVLASPAPAGAAPARAPQLPPGFAAARAAVVADGREVARLVVAGNAARIYARFTPALARQVPRAQVEKVLRDTLASAPIGDRMGESALPLKGNGRAYTADHRWGSRALTLQVSFAADGDISGINLAPRKALAPDPNAGRSLRARLSLPFTEQWLVFWGGPSERQNYHVIAPDQRHANDFVAWRDGSTHRGAGTRNADYHAWGREILAPADARVVEAVDGVRDNRPQIEVQNPRDPAGNHVVLDLGGGEYALLAHLQKGTVRVRKGQRVRRGDVLGRCGNSGNSSEPHLHFHLQDGPELFGDAKGVPLAFSDYRVNGELAMRGTPVQGQFLRPR